MYVKFMFHPDGREALYQCDRFFLSPIPGSYDASDVHLESNHPNGSVTVGAIDRREVSIYVMNDQGKTIESYPSRVSIGSANVNAGAASNAAPV